MKTKWLCVRRGLLGPLFILLLILSCISVEKATTLGGPDDFIKNYTFSRERFGSSSLPFWYRLTEFEDMALSKRDAAIAGDPEALFALGVFASGDVRYMETYNKYLARVKEFVAKIEMDVEKADSAEKKGRLIFEAMCNTFFDQWARGKELVGYRSEQSRLSGIFRNGQFNCISSSLLYIVCARYFGLRVKGVEIPSHIFVQLETDDGKIIEIETTVKGGYGLVHDDEFYKQSSRSWFKNRKLPQSTHKDYLRREIHDPYILIAQNMFNQHTDEKRMATVDRNRLLEASGYLYPVNRRCVKNRLTVYNNEYVFFERTNDYQSSLRMFTTITPFIDTLAQVWINDKEVALNAVQCMGQYYYTLLMNSHDDEAIAFIGIIADLFQKQDSAITVLKHSLHVRTGNYILELNEKKEFIRGLEYLDRFTATTSIPDDFSSKRSSIYESWASHFWDTNNWEQAIDRYKKATAFSSKADDSLRLYDNIVAAYLSWSNDFWDDENWLQSIEKCSTAFVYAKSEEKMSKLKRNITGAYGNWGNALLESQKWEAAMDKYSFARKNADSIPEIDKYDNAIAIVFSNWAVYFFRKDEWGHAIEKISQGLSYVKNEETSKTLYTNLSAAYINWANELGRAGKQEQKKSVLQQCVKQCPSCSKCDALLSKL